VGSLNLVKATSLQSRPFLHCSTLAIGILIISLTIESLYRRSVKNIEWTWILFWALFTHQLRDSQRRGLWFCVFDFNTSPVSKLFYMVTISMMPGLMSLFGKNFRRSDIILNGSAQV